MQLLIIQVPNNMKIQVKLAKSKFDIIRKLKVYV